MASILDLLRKRTADRELSSLDFIQQCVKAEAAGESRKIDIGRLESAMVEPSTSVEAFAAAVERERRIRELRAVIADLPAAAERFRDLAEHARTRKVEGEKEIEAIRTEIDQAERAADAARKALEKCRQAESELQRLLEPPARRQARIEAKGPLSKLRRRKSDLEQEVVDLESAIKNVDVRTFTFSGERDQYIASRQLKLDQAQKKLAEITQRLAQAEIEAGENQAEPETAQASG